MKKILILLLGLCAPLMLMAQDAIELVESVPVETVLDMEEIVNTHGVWLEMISAAERSLDIEIFYLSNQAGEPLEDVLQAIRKAAARGVKVRIISEKKFRKTYPEPLTELNTVDNISVRFIDYDSIAGGVMHAKYFIVDGEHIFLGSQNFDWRSLKHIHELGVRLRNRKLGDLFTRVFNADWALAEGDTIAGHLFSEEAYEVPLEIELNGRSVRVTPVFSPRDLIPHSNLWDETHIVNLIDSARQDIKIHLLNYSSSTYDKTYYEILDNALRRASVRGVKVKIMCSDWAKRYPKINQLKSLEVMPNLQVKLSTIPEYSGGFIPYSRVDHCKFMVVDGKRFWIGTSNWSRDYFYNSRNVGVIVEDDILAKQVDDFFMNSWNSPYAYKVEPCAKYIPPKTK
ncbi:MAG: phospholipase D-like domain-containing protein [candidate division KSB1 bacterium]|nr:phospholipase D-like domain-containing protein [candidate division KSB1 bacterium]